MRRALVVFLAFVGFPAESQIRPYDVTTYPVVYQVPGMSAVTARTGVVYAKGAEGDLKADIYLPSPAPKEARWPAVVFVNGVGGKLNEWEIYRSWARLVAAHGMVGVTAETERGSTGANLASLVERLRGDAASFGIDPERIALWSCSANVPTAYAYLMEKAPEGVKAAVVYYGNAAGAAPRKDLPVFYVMAGRDGPELNAAIRALWGRAIEAGAPWTMVSAPRLTHAFDGLDEGAESKALVKQTVAFLAERLAPPVPDPVPSTPRKALIHVYGRETAQAIQVYREAAAKDPRDAAVVRALAGLQHQTRDYAGAIDSYLAVLALGPGEGAGVIQYNLACAYALSGKKGDALDRLEKAVAAGFTRKQQYLADDDLASLRGDPRFEKLVARLP